MFQTNDGTRRTRTEFDGWPELKRGSEGRVREERKREREREREREFLKPFKHQLTRTISCLLSNLPNLKSVSSAQPRHLLFIINQPVHDSLLVVRRVKVDQSSLLCCSLRSFLLV